MSIVEKKHRRLPAGWRLFVNLTYVSPVENEARNFVELVIEEYRQMFDFTSVGTTQDVFLVLMPNDKVIKRALEVAGEYGYRFVLLSVAEARGSYRDGHIEVTPLSGEPGKVWSPN